MLSIFSKNKKILGLDITEENIKYSLVLRGPRKNIVLSCGTEKIARVEPRNAILSAIRNIIRKTKCKNANISFPSDFVRCETASIVSCHEKDVQNNIELRLKEKNVFSADESVLYFEKFESVNNKNFYNVFISSSSNVSFFQSVFVNSGLNIGKVVGRKDALISSCIGHGEMTNALIVNAEDRRTDIAIFSPFNRFHGVNYFSDIDDIPDLIKDAHLGFYKISNDKIGRFYITGSVAGEARFVNKISGQTRLPIQEADVLLNFYFKVGEVPPITRKESFSYAVALGVAIS